MHITGKLFAYVRHLINFHFNAYKRHVLFTHTLSVTIGEALIPMGVVVYIRGYCSPSAALIGRVLLLLLLLTSTPRSF